MSDRPWYKRYGADFVHGTLGLSLEEKGAYSLCLDLIYDRGGPIPDDARWLAGICNVSVRKWNAIRDRLVDAGKLSAEFGKLTNTRAEKEIEKAAKNSRERAESGRKGGVKQAEKRVDVRENNDLGQAELKHTRINQKLDTREEEPNGSFPETSSGDEKASKRSRTAYSPDFEAFWSGYPTSANMSKKTAFDAWKRLSSEDCEAATSSLPAFRAFCESKPDYQPVYADRYLRQRRFEGHMQTQAKIDAWRELQKRRTA